MAWSAKHITVENNVLTDRLDAEIRIKSSDEGSIEGWKYYSDLKIRNMETLNKFLDDHYKLVAEHNLNKPNIAEVNVRIQKKVNDYDFWTAEAKRNVIKISCVAEPMCLVAQSIEMLIKEIKLLTNTDAKIKVPAGYYLGLMGNNRRERKGPNDPSGTFEFRKFVKDELRCTTDEVKSSQVNQSIDNFYNSFTKINEIRNHLVHCDGFELDFDNTQSRPTQGQVYFRSKRDEFMENFIDCLNFVFDIKKRRPTN